MICLCHSPTSPRLWYKEDKGSGQVPFLLAERARSECARSMRAVKGNLATPEKREKWGTPRWTRAVGDSAGAGIE